MSKYRQNSDASDFSPKQPQACRCGFLPKRQGQTWGWFDFVLAMMVAVVVYSWIVTDEANLSADERAARAVTMGTHEHLPQEAKAAYERGLADAVAGLKGTADGVKLARACMARGL
jgi:hypothetical protein